jgi:CTP synthase (UTP-ammonia lyase)
MVHYHLLVYVVDINTLGGNIHTVEKNIDALFVSSEETGLEVNADKTKYMVFVSRPACRKNHKIKTGNKFFESVEQVKYLGTTVTIQNSIHDEIKNAMKPGKYCSHSPNTSI